MDMINHPAHYNFGSIEVIDFIDAMGAGYDFAAGNAIKYIARADHKGARLEDLKKARFYVQHMLGARNAHSFCHGITAGTAGCDWGLSRPLIRALAEIMDGGEENLKDALAILDAEIGKGDENRCS